MSLDDPQKVHACVDKNEKIVNMIKKEPELLNLYRCTAGIPKEIDAGMKESKLYSTYREKLESIIKEVNSMKAIETSSQ